MTPEREPLAKASFPDYKKPLLTSNNRLLVTVAAIAFCFTIILLGFSKAFTTDCSSSVASSFEVHMAASKSDKAEHGYGEMYAPYFDPLKDKKIAFMEIGLRTGASLDLWRSFFTQAHIYGIDKGAFQGYKRVDGDPRCTIFLGDQEDVPFLQYVVSTIKSQASELDFIIDDGGHTMSQQITSFTHLFPLVKPGGIYYIEDLETSYYSDCSWGCYDKCCGGGPPGTQNTTIDMIKSLVDVLNSDFLKGPNPRKLRNHGKRYSVNPADHMISSIQCWRNLCAIHKKRLPLP